MEDEFTRELRKIFMDQAQSRQEQGHVVDMDEIEAFLTGKRKQPLGDFNGFTMEQMDKMLYDPLGPDCPVKLRQMTEEEICQIPFMRQALHLMNSLAKKELKLTPKGALPIKMVTELYALGSQSFLSDLHKQKTEDKVREVQLLRAVLKEMGLIKIRLGKMSLTAKGIKLLEDLNTLTREIMLFFFKDYNTGWQDMRRHYDIGNIGRLYSLWLLHHFGQVWRARSFYQEEYFKAFPALYIEGNSVVNCYKPRVFNRLFFVIGLCEVNEGEQFRGQNWGEDVRKTSVLDMMFSFEEPGELKDS